MNRITNSAYILYLLSNVLIISSVKPHCSSNSFTFSTILVYITLCIFTNYCCVDTEKCLYRLRTKMQPWYYCCLHFRTGTILNTITRERVTVRVGTAVIVAPYIYAQWMIPTTSTAVLLEWGHSQKWQLCLCAHMDLLHH